MPRPPLPLGTMGEIRTYTLPSGKVRAVAYYRDFDGRTRQVERVGSSATAARNRLKEACRDRGRTDAAAEINGNTTVSALAEVWFSEVKIAVQSGELAAGTADAYRIRLDKQVLPAIGALRLREVTVQRVDRVVKAVRERHGIATAKMTRTVMSGFLGLAARHNALPSNPVRDVARISSPTAFRRSLDVTELRDLREKIAADDRAQAWDLVDFVDLMMATGLRIGETAAITWAAVDDQAGTLEVRATVVRLTGRGLVLQAKPKSKAGWRLIELPSWAVEMLRRRHAEAEPNEWGVVFTSPLGKLRDPSNTQGDLRKLFDSAGYGDVTSHTFRRSVATLMDRAGLSARAAADQLGHARVSMTADRYFGRRLASTGAADLLEQVGHPDTGKNERRG